MGMRSLFPASWFVSSDPARSDRRRRQASLAVERAAGVTVESLETRVLFAAITATLTPAPPPPVVSAAATTEKVIITYVDPDMVALPITGFSASNITVAGPAMATVASVSVTQAAGSGTAVATYVVDAPGATTWNASENGSYTISLHAGVTDADANTAAPNPTFGVFTVAIPPTATVAPVADITTATPDTFNVVVTYVSPGGQILGSTIGTDNITVKGPTGPGSSSLAVASITPATNTNSATEVVTYTVDSPTPGSFSALDDGTYTIGIVGNVTDTTAVHVAANPSVQTFTVNIADVPTAVLTQPANITTSGVSSEPIVVTYTEPGAADMPPVLVAGSSIDTTNISVTSPNATPITITAVTPPSPADGSPLVVTYTASLPAGMTFTDALNGVYTIALANTVTGTNAAPVTPDDMFGTFTVALSDTTGPTATVTAQPVLQSTGTTTQIIVTYVDDGAVLTSSVADAGNGAITVKDTTTGETLNVVDATIAAGTPVNPQTLVVTYTVEQPSDNAFSSSDNGTYTIALTGAPAVTDTTGNPVLANPNLGTLLIDIGNTTRPTGTVTAPAITTNAITGETITFVLTDVAAIKLSTITLNSLKVLAPNGAQLKPTSLSLSSGVDAPVVTAVYVVAAPNGASFTGADNGTYTVALNGVTDIQGLPVVPSGVNTAFAVSIETIQNPQPEGEFGVFNGKMRKLRFYDVPLGTTITLTARGGQGSVTQEGDGSLSIVMNDFGGGLNVNVLSSGNHPVNYESVIVHGSVNNFQSLTGNLLGTFQASGTLTKATFRQLLGTLVTSGSILNLKVLRAVTDSQILSGVLFGADGLFGTNPTTLVDDDTYAPGFIRNINIGGSFSDSVVAAGADPGADLIFGFNASTQTDDDVRAGTATSIIQTITAIGSDGLTRFEAGHFGQFKFAKHKFFPDATTDNRFKGL